MGDYDDRKRKRMLARGRAMERLARRYPAEFTELYESELKAAGVWPDLPPGPKPRVLAGEGA